MKEKDKNYLDFIPERNPDFHWDINEKQHVVIQCENKGFYNRIAQKFFKKPRVSTIELDELGSFVWTCIDGRMSIYNISGKVKMRFGDKAEPLFKRLIEYFKILYSNKFISYV